MTRAPTRVITVSREFGAGGSELAAQLGASLGWPVLDHDLIHLVADRLRLDDKTVEDLDEHPPSMLARIASVLIIPQPELYSFPPATDLASADDIAQASQAIIAEAAESPPIVIVGHGAQCILAGRDDVLHVRVVAPVQARLTRVINRLGVDAADAAKMLHRADADRRSYVQRYFHQDLRNELLYDMLINTGRVSIEEAAALVGEAVRHRESAGTDSSLRTAGLP